MAKGLALAWMVMSLGGVEPWRGFLHAATPSPLQVSTASQWQDILRNLRHPDAAVRLEAVERLGAAGDAAAAEYIAPLVTDPDDRVQAAAIDAELTFFLIEPIAERRVFSLTGASRSRAQEAFDAGPSVRTATPAPVVVLDNLLTAVRDANARIRFDAIHALGVIAEAPLPPAQAKALVDGLDHYEPIIRAVTARVIGRLHVMEAGDRLIAGLNDSNALVRRYCAEALGRVREARAIQSLTELAAFYGRGDLGNEMLLALARIAHPASRDLLRSAMTDASAPVRRAAAEGLGRLRDRDSLQALRGLASGDSSPAVRLAGSFAVGLLDAPQTHVLAGAMASPDLAAQARDYLLEIGADAVPGIQAALGVATSARNRAELIHLLGFVGTRSTVALIQPYATDGDERIRLAASDAIARLAR